MSYPVMSTAFGFECSRRIAEIGTFETVSCIRRIAEICTFDTVSFDTRYSIKGTNFGDTRYSIKGTNFGDPPAAFFRVHNMCVSEGLRGARETRQERLSQSGDSQGGLGGIESAGSSSRSSIAAATHKLQRTVARRCGGSPPSIAAWQSSWW